MSKHTTPPAQRPDRLRPVVGNRNAHAQRWCFGRWRTPGRFARFVQRELERIGKDRVKPVERMGLDTAKLCVRPILAARARLNMRLRGMHKARPV